MAFSIIVHENVVYELMTKVSSMYSKLLITKEVKEYTEKELTEIYKTLEIAWKKADKNNQMCQFDFEIHELIQSLIFETKGWKFVEVRELKINNMERP